MEITWYGYSCFRITERGHTSVLTDPYQPELDFAQRGLKADLVTVSYERAAAQLDDIRGEKYVISAPGEYEIGELFVTGLALHCAQAEGGRAIAYHFEYPNGLNFLHLGVLRSLPDPALIERLDEVHALLLPIGGSALAGDALSDLIGTIDPRYVLPMHWPEVDAAAYESALETLLRTMGAAGAEAQDSLRISASSLGEGTQVVRLRPAT